MTDVSGKRFVSTITEDGYRAAVSNAAADNGFRVELAHLDVYQGGQKKGRFPLTGTVIGGKQVRVRAAVTTQTGEYFFNEVRLIDGVSGNEFAVIRREDGSDIDFVSPFKTAFFQCDLTFAPLNENTVTVISATDEINALWAELDTRGKVKWSAITGAPDATTEQKGLVMLHGSVDEEEGKAITPAAVKAELDKFKEELDKALEANAIPAGQIAFFAGNALPSGWLKANGAAVSRTTYAKLFEAIGTTYGEGDGSTTFTLPDLRGEFVRGWDDGRQIDRSRALGSHQEDALQNITGKIPTSSWVSNGSGAFQRSSQGEQDGDSDGRNGWIYDFDASRVVRTANETRPRNIALLACIKT